MFAIVCEAPDIADFADDRKDIGFPVHVHELSVNGATKRTVCTAFVGFFAGIRIDHTAVAGVAIRVGHDVSPSIKADSRFKHLFETRSSSSGVAQVITHHMVTQPESSF